MKLFNRKKTLLNISLFILFLAYLIPCNAQNVFVLARLQFDGGGDWYNDPEILPNLALFCNKNIKTSIQNKEKVIRLSDKKLYDYPFLFATGHGNIKLNSDERNNLRNYLENGGFLYVDDDYGMDKSFRQEMKAVFPDKDFVELPSSHPIFHDAFEFPAGLPKIHEHDKKRPQALSIFNEDGRMLVLYTYESNISDGWANADTHDDPPAVKDKALKFGANIIYYFLSGMKNE